MDRRMMQRSLTSSLSLHWQNRIPPWCRKTLSVWLGCCGTSYSCKNPVGLYKLSVWEGFPFICPIFFSSSFLPSSLYIVISWNCLPDRHTTKYFLMINLCQFEQYVFRDWYFHTSCCKKFGMKRKVKANRIIQQKWQVTSYYIFLDKIILQ